MPASGKPARPTLREVADRAGVSQATVSKVLNGRADVSSATRERVFRMIDEAGYRARGARTPQSERKRVVAVFDSVTSQYASLILEGMVAAAADLDAEVTVQLTPPQLADLSSRRWAQSWVHEQSRSVGVVAVTSSLPLDVIQAAARLKLPLVTIDPADKLQSDLVSISSTDWTSGRTMTEHMLELGHRRIGWVGGPTASTPTIERFRGYRSALELAQIPLDRGLCRNGPYSFEAGLEAATALLRITPRPTAIIGASDAIAFGVMEAVRREGLEVPLDVSVGGFDDIPQAEWVSPKLTSVRAPLTGIGRMAMETVLGMSAGKEPPSHHIRLSTRLMVRESTAPPASDETFPSPAVKVASTERST